ncbi:MAG: hypothetical protein AB7P08_06685 [Burkholderiales bacterium]
MNTRAPFRSTLTFVTASIALATASGCASIVKGTSQSVTVSTDPTAATCHLSREGQPLGVVNPTPGTVQVGKASGTISILCKKTGYQDAAGTLASSFQAMTFGNILLGGIIGVAVDAASGAMHEYPPMVTVTLVPDEFATVGERDDFFDRLRATFLREAGEVKERTRSTCTDNCEAQVKAVDDGVAAKLTEIEGRRFAARVRLR